MTVTVQKPLSEEELAAGLVLCDPLLFREYFFADELTEPPSLEQRLMFGDQSQRVILCTGRKLGKTVHTEATVLQDILLNENAHGMDEAMFVTPGDVHMQQFVDRLFARIQRSSILKGIIKIRRGDNMMLESDNLRYYFRVEGLSGTDRNMTGLRAKYIRGDEMSFSGWACHNSRIQTALPGAKFLYAGVPNGVRDTPFFHLDKRWEGRLWSKHNYSTFINPIYKNPKLKHELVEEYGGEETQGYKTQVLGEWGEEVVSSFPPGSIAISEAQYFVTKLSGLEAGEKLFDVALKVHIPSVRCFQFAIGWDWGHSPDPATIFGAYRKSEDDVWQVYCRLELRRVALPHQVAILRHLIEKVFDGSFVGLVCDNISAIQAIQGTDTPRAKRYIWAIPAGSTQVDLLPPKKPEGEAFTLSDSMAPPEQALEVASIRNKEYFIGKLKEWLINACEDLQGRKLWLAHDDEVEMELGSTTERKTLAGYTIYYGPKNPNVKGGMLDHNREGLQYLCQAIEEGLKLEVEEDESDDVLSVLGWGAPMQEGTWVPPWERGS